MVSFLSFPKDYEVGCVLVKRLAVLCCCLLSLSQAVYGKIVPTIFGALEEDNSTVLALLDSSAMQRLKHIDQSGPDAYFTAGFPKFSRYDHSLGVYALLKRYQAPFDEQIAGLLHDTSHTVFSHLGDIIFQKGEARVESYQDDIHLWFLDQMGIKPILEKENLSLESIYHKQPKFLALEQPYPDMNADRIEYNLHTALLFNDLEHSHIEEILKHLRFDKGQWYFTNQTTAKRFAKLSTYYTRNFWGSPRNVATYTIAGAIVNRALDIHLVSKDDLHFGIDEDFVLKFKTSNDKIIQPLLQMLKHVEDYYTVSNPGEYDVYQPIKMRGINPLVLNKGRLERLSTLSVDFHQEYENTKKYTKKGVYIKFVKADDWLIQYLKEGNV